MPGDVLLERVLFGATVIACCEVKAADKWDGGNLDVLFGVEYGEERCTGGRLVDAKLEELEQPNLMA